MFHISVLCLLKIDIFNSCFISLQFTEVITDTTDHY